MRIHFSVIIPVYNCAALLPRAIRSVLSQKGEDFEIIIVNDGSTDAFNKALQMFQSEKKITVIHHLHNRGLGPSRNTGIRSARGEWIVLLDADNALFPSAFEELKRISETVGNEVAVIYTFAQTFDGKLTIQHPDITGKVSFDEIVSGRVSGEYLSVVRRPVFLKHLYDESLGTHRECPPLVWYAIAKEYSFYVDSHVLMYYETRRTDRLCSSDMTDQKIQELSICHTRVLERFLPDLLPEHTSKVAELYRRQALYAFLDGGRRKGLRSLIRSLRYGISVEVGALILFSILGRSLSRKVHSRILRAME